MNTIGNFAGYFYNCTNVPTGTIWNMGYSINYNNWYTQVLTNLVTNDTFQRVKNENGWTDWQKMGPFNLDSVECSHYRGDVDPAPSSFSRLGQVVKWVPANSFFLVTANLIWVNAQPKEVGIGNYNDGNDSSELYVHAVNDGTLNHMRATYFGFSGSGSLPVCAWGRWSASNYNFYYLDVIVFKPSTYNT